jgi:hypothetical protein
LRVGIPTREVGDIVGKVGGRPRKVERNVEGPKEFGGGRVNGRMEMALKAKRLGPRRRFTDLQRRRLRWRSFRAGFAFSFLGSREMRDSGEVGNGNLGFRHRGNRFLVYGHFISRGNRSCVKKR